MISLISQNFPHLHLKTPSSFLQSECDLNSPKNGNSSHQFLTPVLTFVSISLSLSFFLSFFISSWNVSASMSAPLCDFSHGAVCLDYAGDWFVYIIFSVCLSVFPILLLFFLICASFIQHLFCLCSISSVFYLCIFDAAFLLSIFVFVFLYLLYFNFFLSKLYIQFSLFCLSVSLFVQVLNVMRGSVETVKKKSWESSSNQIGIILWVVDAAKH